MACGGSADPTATTAPADPPDPTEAPADTDNADSTATEEPDAVSPGSNTRDWNVLGSPDATVTVLDYSDFQ